MAGVILTTFPADGDAIRGKIGITAQDLSDAQIQTDAYLNAAEAYITTKVAYQTATNAAPTVAQIMGTAAPAVAADRVFLRDAVIAYIAYLFTAGATNAVDVSKSDFEQTKDLGGIGAQWRDQGQVWLHEAQLMLYKITNFKRWLAL